MVRRSRRRGIWRALQMGDILGSNGGRGDRQLGAERNLRQIHCFNLKCQQLSHWLR